MLKEKAGLLKRHRAGLLKRHRIHIKRRRIYNLFCDIYINILVRTKLVNTLFIRTWSGRTGNNVMQLIQASIFAERHNISIRIPAHQDFVSTKSLDAGIQLSAKTSNFFSSSFFYGTCLFPAAEDSEFKNAVENIRIFVQGEQDIKLLWALVMHVRSGDIFSNPHPLYWQPPLAFYRKTIQVVGNIPIYLVYDGSRANPVIDQLQHEFGDRIQLVSESAIADYQMLMAASHLVMSRSTFASTAARLSKNLKHLYTFSGADTFPSHFLGADVQVHTFASKTYANYYAKNHWTASDPQLNLLLNCDDVVEL